jgi:hypothetical protein
MEETYGRKWAKKSDGNYFSPADCTEGNLKFHLHIDLQVFLLLQRIGGFSEYANKNQLQQDHPCVIRLIKQKYLRQPASKSLPYRLGDPQPLNPSDGPAQGILRILRNQVNLPLLVNLS